MCRISGICSNSFNYPIQLLMQIQCNHGQKQTENELQGTNYKDKLTEQDRKNLVDFKNKK